MSRRTRIAFAAAVAALSLAVGVAPASAGTLDQQQTIALQSTAAAGPDRAPNPASVAQTFTPGLTGALDQVDLFLGSPGLNDGPLTVEIRDVVPGGAPDGPVLASALVQPSAVVPLFAFVEVTFGSPAQVLAGSQYAIVAYTGGADLYGWGAAVTNPYAGGTTFGTATSPPVTWTAFPAVDLAFKTYVDTTSTTYDFTGFLSPVNNPTDPDPNSVKAGQSVPVKFSLGGDQGLDVLDDEAPNPKLVFSSCDPTDEADPVGTSTANNGLTYDALTDTYTYVWKTVKSWKGKCGTFTLKLDDGSVHTAEFLFK